MKYAKLLTVSLFAAIVGVVVVGKTANAQDPVKVDPTHYKVAFQNAKVRVLNVHYGAHDKSPMHSHPASVVVYLTDAHVKYTRANGKTGEWTGKAGEARWAPADKHAIENLGDQSLDEVLIELKR